MKGIILAGGSGTRLYPLTKVISKQLLPIRDKPMIYYPLSILMLAGIREILIISTPDDTPKYRELLGDGENLGVDLQYAVQDSPDGLAQAFIIGEKFIGDDSVALILGDNIFYGNGLKNQLEKAKSNANNGYATVFGYYVEDPERFGIADFDESGNVKNIEEKPQTPLTNYAVTGLYFYDNKAVEFSKQVKPSLRGELEITDLNKMYLHEESLKIITLGRGFTWLDTGTHSSLAKANEYIRIVEEHQGLKIGCIEEIAFVNGWISEDTLLKQAKLMNKNLYGQHLLNVYEGKIKY